MDLCMCMSCGFMHVHSVLSHILWIYACVFSFESYPVDLCMPPLGGSLVYLQCIRSVFGIELYPMDLSFLCVWLVPIMDPPRSEQPLYSRQMLCYGLKLL